MICVTVKSFEYRNIGAKLDDNTHFYLDKSLRDRFSTGDVLRLNYNAKIIPVQVTPNSWFNDLHDKIMVSPLLISNYSVPLDKVCQLEPSSREDFKVDYVDVFFKKQYLSRSDLRTWQLAMVGSVVYVGGPRKVLCWVGSVECLFFRKKAVSFGVVRESSHVNFRSKSAVVNIYIQMSAEMWMRDSNSEFYSQKAVYGFLNRLFLKWREHDCNHSVNIVFFSRILYDAQSIDDFPASVRPSICVDAHNTYYEDVHWVLLRNSCFSDLKSAMRLLRTSFESYEETIGSIHAGCDMPDSTISVASQGNLLETLNISLDVFDKYHTDRSFSRLGQVVLFVTAGDGYFEVSRKLTSIAMQKALILGTSIDIVFLDRPPLHDCPLFMFFNRDKYAYYTPMWIMPSFYTARVYTGRQTGRPSVHNRLHPLNMAQQRRIIGTNLLLSSSDSDLLLPLATTPRRSPILTSLPASHDSFSREPRVSPASPFFHDSQWNSPQIMRSRDNIAMASSTSDYAIELKCAENPFKIRRNWSDPLDASNWRWRSVFYFHEADSPDDAKSCLSQIYFMDDDSRSLEPPENQKPFFRTTFESQVPENFVVAPLLPPTTNHWPVSFPNYERINYQLDLASFPPHPGIPHRVYSSSLPLMRELSMQRMSRDFQLVLDSSQRSPEPCEFKLSDGLTFHVLRRVGHYINVVIHKSKDDCQEFSVDYKSHIRHADVSFFNQTLLTFRTPHQDFFPWNYLDNFMREITACRSFAESLRYWKSKFAIIPREFEYLAKKRFYVPSMPAIPRQEKLIATIFKILCGFGECEHFRDQERTPCSLVRPAVIDVLKTMRSPKTSFPFLPSVGDSSLACFTSYDAVDWLISSPSTETQFADAISIFQRLMNNGDIRHVDKSIVDNRFVYGFYLYCLASSHKQTPAAKSPCQHFSLTPAQVEVVVDPTQVFSSEISPKNSLICFSCSDNSKPMQFVRLSSNSLLPKDTIFSLEFDWLSISGDYLLNFINNCCDVCSDNKFKFTPIPTNPFPRRNRPIVDPFRLPFFVSLNADLIHQKGIRDLAKVQMSILKCYGFYRVVDLVQSPVNKEEAYSYYVHITGHILLLPIRDPFTLDLYHVALDSGTTSPGFIWSWNLMYSSEINSFHMSSLGFFVPDRLNTFMMDLLNDFKKCCSAQNDNRLESLCQSLLS